MLTQAQVGPIASTTSIAPGTQVPSRAGQLGDGIVSHLQGDYYEPCYRRASFSAANQTPRVTNVGLNTASTGLILSNPVGSTVNLVLKFIGWAFPVAPAADLVVGLALGYNSGTNVTHTTPVTPRSNFYGVGASPVGLVDESATLPTVDVLVMVFGKVDTAAITTSSAQSNGFVDLKGSIILPPGAYAHIYTSSVANAAGFLGSFSWDEVPI
jgi:hypothetical protein